MTQNNDLILIALLLLAPINNWGQKMTTHFEAAKWLKCNNISLYEMPYCIFSNSKQLF